MLPSLYHHVNDLFITFIDFTPVSVTADGFSLAFLVQSPGQLNQSQITKIQS
ncbi:hypothetical protein PN463_20360 [Dolichospermum circinale CS-537/03]|uniref:hypothetical protein n=1 Tax=Dolichospermum circinale TaxID=109265 RepID=UPI0004107E51|nr:hypothetical protein [Dolichospermum circinale]MDB9462825.1 hypothetical protein [Dolichospermum circinale CS-541/04]MDB9480952.1 hypothetical protein [Dolichospermum circinale CS-537/03]MDB9483172.1 hypothetical protein [Dolichospermum circinale CS-537/05]MDB9545989.1 hypothetical protein [Dolichospermum circinale CS-1031]